MAFLILVFLLQPLLAEAGKCWPFKSKINQVDAQGRKQGKWVSYWDDESKDRMSMTHFKDDHELGISKYYYLEGRKRVKFNIRKDGHLRVKYFTETGQIEKKGHALMIVNAEEVRYCWHGKWKFYENRKCIKVSEYVMGEEAVVLFAK